MITMYIIIAIVLAYLAMGYFLHLVLFPERKPEPADYFTPGLQFYSREENVKQNVIKCENGHVFCTAEVGPFAAGPPKHIHEDFDEFFEVSNGELTVWVDGRTVKIRPGERLFIPKGTPHKPYNETAETIYINTPIAFPEKFAFGLSQVYGVMDHNPTFGRSPKTIFQMAMFSSAGFDSYLAEGPPVWLQKTLNFLLVPLARLMGYKSYYHEFDVRNRK